MFFNFRRFSQIYAWRIPPVHEFLHEEKLSSCCSCIFPARDAFFPNSFRRPSRRTSTVHMHRRGILKCLASTQPPLYPQAACEAVRAIRNRDTEVAGFVET